MYYCYRFTTPVSDPPDELAPQEKFWVSGPSLAAMEAFVSTTLGKPGPYDAQLMSQQDMVLTPVVWQGERVLLIKRFMANLLADQEVCALLSEKEWFPPED